MLQAEMNILLFWKVVYEGHKSCHATGYIISRSRKYELQMADKFKPLMTQGLVQIAISKDDNS